MFDGVSRRNTVRRMTTLSFRAAPAEAKAIRAAARARRLTVSEYLRCAALPAAVARRPGRRQQWEPGRVVVQGTADAPMLSSADVASALYD